MSFFVLARNFWRYDKPVGERLRLIGLAAMVCLPARLAGRSWEQIATTLPRAVERIAVEQGMAREILRTRFERKAGQPS